MFELPQGLFFTNKVVFLSSISPKTIYFRHSFCSPKRVQITNILGEKSKSFETHTQKKGSCSNLSSREVFLLCVDVLRVVCDQMCLKILTFLTSNQTLHSPSKSRLTCQLHCAQNPISIKKSGAGVEDVKMSLLWNFWPLYTHYCSKSNMHTSRKYGISKGHFFPHFQIAYVNKKPSKPSLIQHNIK